jgi:hypothetical protein
LDVEDPLELNPQEKLIRINEKREALKIKFLKILRFIFYTNKDLSISKVSF